jgi:hypothetical protein
MGGYGTDRAGQRVTEPGRAGPDRGGTPRLCVIVLNRHPQLALKIPSKNLCRIGR